MRMPSPLKFRMLHGLILVAGIAGCLSMRWTASVYLSEFMSVIGEWQKGHSILLVLSWVPKLISESAPWMAVWTLTFLAMSLCPPRPRLRGLTRRPGFVALFAASFPIVMVLGLDVIDRLASQWIFFASIYVNPLNRREFDVEYLLGTAQALPGYSVGATWALLWIGRRWRGVPSRIDRTGRIVGFYWMGMTLVAKFYPYLY